ncbi:MAG TPA: hypothetical protein VIF62_14550 [Labilithrix sp.]
MQGYPPGPPGYPPGPPGYPPGPPQQPNPYAPPYGQPPMGYGPQGFGPQVDTSDGGTAVLIWGILGFALCAFCAPVAWVKGNAYMKTCAAMGVRPSSAGSVGRILGIIGTALLILGVLGGALSVCASAISH